MVATETDEAYTIQAFFDENGRHDDSAAGILRGLVRAFLATESGWTRTHTHKVPPPPIADPGVCSKLYLVLSALEVIPSMADVVYFLAFRRCSASYYTVRKMPNMQYSTSLRHNLFNLKWLSFGCDANLFLMKLCHVMISARWSQEGFAGHQLLDRATWARYDMFGKTRRGGSALESRKW